MQDLCCFAFVFTQKTDGKSLNIYIFIIIILSESVHRHMQQYEVEYLQFAFRWMNNLLMRELPLRCTIRLWDTYQVQQSYCYSAFFLFSLYLYVFGLQVFKNLIISYCCFDINYISARAL